MGYLFLIGMTLFYFLPSIIANNRGHKDVAAIFIGNLFLGWTIFGWIVALVWAFIVTKE